MKYNRQCVRYSVLCGWRSAACCILCIVAHRWLHNKLHYQTPFVPHYSLHFQWKYPLAATHNYTAHYTSHVTRYTIHYTAHYMDGAIVHNPPLNKITQKKIKSRMLDLIENGRNKITHHFCGSNATNCCKQSSRARAQETQRDTASCIYKSLPPAKETCDGHSLGNGLWDGFGFGFGYW